MAANSIEIMLDSARAIQRLLDWYACDIFLWVFCNVHANNLSLQEVLLSENKMLFFIIILAAESLLYRLLIDIKQSFAFYWDHCKKSTPSYSSATHMLHFSACELKK